MYRVGIPRLCILSPERVCTVSESMFSPWLYKLCISWNMRLGRDSVLMKPSQNRVPFLLDFDNVLTQYRPCTDPVITRFGFFRILLQNLYRAKKGSFSGFVQKIYRVKKVSIQSRSVCTLPVHCRFSSVLSRFDSVLVGNRSVSVRLHSRRERGAQLANYR